MNERQKISRTHSGRSRRFALFLLLPCFTNNGMPCPWLGMKAFGPPWCFSAPLRWSSRCSQLVQKGRHRPSHLRQRQNRAPSFPRPITSSHQGTSQDQQVMGTRDHLAPTFRSFWRTHPWHIPAYHLLVEAIALLGEERKRYVELRSARGAGSSPFQTNQLTFGSRALPLAPWRMIWITETSNERAVRRCKCFQLPPSIHAPFTSTPSHVASGVPWLLSSLH